MKLKSLRLHGFKSFPDPTSLEFHEGITAIVGPNGCGKSNIGDAIRWVLGEQRPTAIRGAKMEEAIFQGTVARRSVNRGSVSMIVTNEDGALPTPFEEVEIGRTVHRDGGSDYRLNRASCRLRDIVDLCRDTGLGANAYSVIEIRMIDAILSERTDERRSLFEEAAGIGKYKDRRRAALRRLETSEVDLQRVEDVIGEVQSKVRSLARQKGKAQRYRELRERRLAVEVAVVRAELETLNARLREVDAALRADREDAAGMAARLSAAETGLESARLEHVEAEKARAGSASRLDAVAAELSRVEREVAVADERIANWKRRLVQIDEEQAAQSRLRARSEDERITLGEERDRCKVEFTKVQADFTHRRNAAAEVRERLTRARQRVRDLEEQARALAEKVARIEGSRYSAQLQANELERRFERLTRDAREGAGALREIESQGDLFSDRRADAAAKAEDAVRAFEGARRQLHEVRERLRVVRGARASAETRLSSLEAERDALERVAAAGAAEAVAAAACAALPECIHGLLSDFVEVPEDSARGVDEIMGRFGVALVARSRDDMARIARWYRDESDGAAALLLLPAGAAPEPAGALPAGITAVGAGAPWVRALLGGVRAAEEGWTDVRGAVHLFPETGSEGRVERRERLDALASRIRAAAAEMEDTRDTALAMEEELRECEATVDAASERVLATRDEARAAEANAVAQTDRRERLRTRQGEIARQVEGTRSARDSALERARAAEAEGAELRSREEGDRSRVEAERAALGAIEAEWEQAREAEAESSILAARLESELQRLAGRIADTGESAGRAAARVGALQSEAAELGENMARVRARRSEGRDALERLFAKRDELRRVAAAQDRALGAASEAVLGAERRVREMRTAEREAVGRRHQLEMESQEIRNQASRTGERLEAEWNRPVEELLAEATEVEGHTDELRAELHEIVNALGRIGPVNMLAFEEHAEESERLEFLVGQREDLDSARNDLRSAIRRINITATERFMNSFEAIRENFLETFRHLFNGGEAQLWLSDPDNPLESPIEIHASPRGKRTQRIDLLSGGERALTALSLLFGIYLVKPSPFCVLDEVDAPLDESNITRFNRLLQGFKARTQFVVITHNPRTIEAADWIYGVTMEEPGVSSVVGVRLEAPTARGPAA